LNQILEKYDDVAAQLGDDFFAEFKSGLVKARDNPRFFHFDACGLRRCNLNRFPYHFLYDIQSGIIRIWVVRHDQQNPRFGMRRSWT
jgi:plasmid stabilization system protein ParE